MYYIIADGKLTVHADIDRTKQLFELDSPSTDGAQQALDEHVAALATESQSWVVLHQSKRTRMGHWETHDTLEGARRSAVALHPARGEGVIYGPDGYRHANR